MNDCDASGSPLLDYNVTIMFDDMTVEQKWRGGALAQEARLPPVKRVINQHEWHGTPPQ